jgi:autoinducer 2 (AI-2) kinase
VVFLALDAGSGGGRALVCDATGRARATAYRAWTFNHPPAVFGASEFEPGAVWDALAEAAREALTRAAVQPDAVRAVAATSFRDGFVLLDRDGHELLCSTNQDGRAIAQGARLAESHGETIHHTTGRWPLGLDVAARLVWLREERLAIYARAAHLLMASDWLTFRLSGELVAEPTNASSSLLFDIGAGAWSRRICDALEISPDLLPPLRRSGEVAGSLRPDAAEALGLRVGTPVAIGGGDSPLAVLGCGALDPDATVAVAGTTMPVLRVADAPRADASRRTWVGAHALAGRWLRESNAGPAGVAYRWVRDAFYPKADYAVVEGEARDAPPGAGLAFLGPWIADFSRVVFPPPLALVFSSQLGFGPALTRGGLARAALENIAFAAWGNVQQLGAADTLHLCGGLARSALFAQILADVANAPLRVAAEADAAALGASMCAAVGAGAYADWRAAAAAMARATTVEPDAERARKQQSLYRKWIKMQQKVVNL